MKNIATLILAGGRSSRIGFPKSWLNFEEDKTYAEHLVRLYSEAGVNEIVVVINSDFCGDPWKTRIHNLKSKAVIIENQQPQLGRLHSIRLGLQVPQSEYTFIQNVDSPYISKELIEKMALAKSQKGTTIPVHNGKKGHPVLIGPDVKSSLLFVPIENRTLKDVLANFNQTFMDTEDKGILVNVNTKSQYQLYRDGYIE